MTLILVESFESTPTTQKWNAGTVPGNSGSAARTGIRSMAINAVATRSLAASEEHATMIAGMAFIPITPFSSSGGNYFFYFSSDAGATTHITIGINTSTRAIEVRRGDHTSGTLLGSSAAPAFNIDSLWHYIEAKVVLDDTAGSVVVRLDDREILNLTGIDTKNAGTKTVLDYVIFHVPQQTTSQNNYGDDIYLCNGAGSVNNTFLGPVKIETLMPNGNGNSSVGVGSDANSTDNYLLVDEPAASINTADYVEFATTGDKDTYAFENLAQTAGTVVAVVANMHAYKSDAGAREVKGVARLSGTETSVVPVVTLANSSYRTPYSVFETKPGGGAWTISDVNSAEFGVEAT